MEFYPSHGQLAHFSINVNDIDRARDFYSTVFGWQFHAFGPPGFYMVETSPGATPVPVLGSMQKRRELTPGAPMRGLEGTIAVQNLDEAISAIEANGGRIVMPRSTLPMIGHLAYFEDPETNVLGVMQYDSKAS